MIQGLQSYLKTHQHAFVVAALVGLIYGSHHFFISRILEPEETYVPITAASQYDEATFYALRANAAYQGQWLVGDINTYEHEGGPVLLSPLNPLISAGFGRLGGSLKNGFILSDIVMPAIIFLLVYAIAVELVSYHYLAVLFALFFVFAPKLGVAVPPVSWLHIKELTLSFFPFIRPDVLHFLSFEEPKITFPFFAACILFGIRALKRETLRSAIYAGISFGLLFYTYFYDWATMTAAYILMGGYFLFMKDGRRLKQLGVIASVALGVASLYILNMVRLYGVAHAEELVARTGREVSHRIRIGPVVKTYIRNFVIGGLLWLGLSKKQDEHRIPAVFVISLLCAYVVTVNAQVITGFNIQPDHWYRTLFLPLGLALLILGVAGYERWLKSHITSRYLSLGAALMIVWLLVAVGYGQYRYSISSAHAYTIPAEQIRTFEWLNSQTPRRSVVGTISFEMNNLLMLHTHNKIFVPNGLNTLASDNEIWERYFFINKLFGVLPEVFARHLRESNAAYYLFSETYASPEFNAAFSGRYVREFSADMVDTAASRYAAYAGAADGKAPFRLDYVMFLDGDLPAGAYSERLSTYMKKVYSEGGVSIYQRQ